ncbi:DUF1638 domain-containing protein [Clostridium sp. CM027]|uniref:DUF1638 domain-containing protein n=1 Tax=Clostridium sp. CM027 TaxID=2849865 RepID=UPI001C6EAFB7|nr:DUF1638 domain-containing protein [Clostridium sp. CM027]MBW9146776.1 DUF1638 domain-containing protein [Clostridium sp. CM027]UVE41569.1 DUF1638 domain-containing protein [Clostridium sp. CM027]
MTMKIIACEVMKKELLSITPVLDVEFEFISMNLHLYPEKLRKELQCIIERSTGYSRIILAFGLCGGAAKGLVPTHCTLTIPKVHDCISIFLDSGKLNQGIYEKKTGTFYLSCGYMNSEKSILAEHNRIKDKYGEKKALKVLSRMYEGYNQILFIKTGCCSEKADIEQSEEIAKLLNLSHDTIKGSDTFIEQIVKGPWDNDKFINISPGGIVKEDDFNIGIK